MDSHPVQELVDQQPQQLVDPHPMLELVDQQPQKPVDLHPVQELVDQQPQQPAQEQVERHLVFQARQQPPLKPQLHKLVPVVLAPDSQVKPPSTPRSLLSQLEAQVNETLDCNAPLSIEFPSLAHMCQQWKLD